MSESLLGPVPEAAPPAALTTLLPTQTAACPTPASRAPSAAASPTAPGPAAPAQWASWATGPTARTWTRWVPTQAGQRGTSEAGGSPLLVPTVCPGHRCLLLHEQQVPALRQHRPRVPLPALPTSLQGDPALRGRPGGRTDGKAGEQRARPFVCLSLPNRQPGSGEVEGGNGRRRASWGEWARWTHRPWRADHVGQSSAVATGSMRARSVFPEAAASAVAWGSDRCRQRLVGTLRCLQAAPEGAESQ